MPYPVEPSASARVAAFGPGMMTQRAAVHASVYCLLSGEISSLGLGEPIETIVILDQSDRFQGVMPIERLRGVFEFCRQHFKIRAGKCADEEDTGSQKIDFRDEIERELGLEESRLKQLSSAPDAGAHIPIGSISRISRF